MSKHEDIEKRAEKLAEGFLQENHLEIVDVEYVKEAGSFYLRYYIDKDGGVNIGDCEMVSRYLSAELDRDDFIPDVYTLEVSSPGLGRALKKEKDYQRNLNKDVELRLYKECEGLKELVGTLKEFDKNSITVLSDEKALVIDRKNIALIREYVDWDAE